MLPTTRRTARSPRIQAFSLRRPGFHDRPATSSKIPAFARIHFTEKHSDRREAREAREMKTGCSTNGKQTVSPCQVEGSRFKAGRIYPSDRTRGSLVGKDLVERSMDPAFTVTHSRPSITRDSFSRARLTSFPPLLKRTPPADSSRQLFDRWASTIIVKNFSNRLG